MAQIGHFSRTQTGFEGEFRTLGIREQITLVPAEPSDAENAPKYRVRLGDEEGLDNGAGWQHVGERAGEFVSITVYSPLLGGTYRANLFRASDDGAAWVLNTNLPSKKRQEG
ncbi:DUF736 domain-containing protein [Sinorhizobium saheli]|uniref:DUF736 domain-containing protein n=1 Tax=Sinorhizobium saheli TaxID=36856 RepID=A0A178Y7G8_SINSA|nr:DUF736 domain-containing protein [Sinorhizobium saheli]MQW87830.1 DUF736 family protein [Sinorhizobium saheli]OAP43132.1 hypothetical protein ATB98_15420 [Sinorhizobium saheli]